jgi:hypothetical protein
MRRWDAGRRSSGGLLQTAGCVISTGPSTPLSRDVEHMLRHTLDIDFECLEFTFGAVLRNCSVTQPTGQLHRP